MKCKNAGKIRDWVLNRENMVFLNNFRCDGEMFATSLEVFIDSKQKLGKRNKKIRYFLYCM